MVVGNEAPHQPHRNTLDPGPPDRRVDSRIEIEDARSCNCTEDFQTGLVQNHNFH